MIRAKFRCDEIAQTVNGSQIRLSPVTSGSEENANFFKWTPTGKIDMGIVNSEVANQFVPGKDFYVDFTPAD